MCAKYPEKQTCQIVTEHEVKEYNVVFDKTIVLSKGEDTILYINSMMQTIPNLTFVEGFSKNLNDMLCTNCLVIVDDLICQCCQNQIMSNFLTKGSHHRGVSVMYLMQNLSPSGR